MAETGSKSLGNEHLGLGATGKFPKDQMNEDDHGELKVAMGINKEHKRIMIDFGKKISWIGMEAEEARELAKSLLENANKLDQLE